MYQSISTANIDDFCGFYHSRMRVRKEMLAALSSIFRNPAKKRRKTSPAFQNLTDIVYIIK